MGQTDWIPGLFALAVGLAGGLALWLKSRAGAERVAAPVAAAPSDGRPARLEAQIAALRELELEAPTPALARERYQAELGAARELQQLEAAAAVAARCPPTPVAAKSPPAPVAAVAMSTAQAAPVNAPAAAPRARTSGFKPFLLGVWAGATAVLLFVFIRDFAAPRAGGMGPEPMGGPAMGAGPAMGGMTAMGGTTADERPGAGARATGAPEVRGVLRLAPGVQVKPGATVFVIARPAGTLRGPPVAVARLVASSFPADFTLGEENSMTGQPFPEKALIQVRVDFDGNPMTHDPAEPVGMVDHVARGATDLSIELAVP